jgi:hypothetical protein
MNPPRNRWNYTVREIHPSELEFAHKLLDWSRNIERVGEVKAKYWLADILEGDDTFQAPVPGFEGADTPESKPRSAATGIAPSEVS